MNLNAAGESVNGLVTEAQKGNVNAREKIITDFQWLIKKIIAGKTSGGESLMSRDEYSIGLIAFNEAIDNYQQERGSFQSFASTLINNRLIDYHRAQKKHHLCNTYLVEAAEVNPGSQADPADRVDTKMEMEEFLAKLASFNINMPELVDETPKHQDSRLLCLRIAEILAGDPELTGYLIKHRAMPLKELLPRARVNRKTVQRHRKYIIAVFLILTSNLDTMKGYVQALLSGGGTSE